MKYLYLILTFVITSNAVYSQETVKRSKHISSLDENFEVLRTNKKIRQGEYTAKHNQETLARGTYLAGKRTGNWIFYNFKGEAVQSYNYTNNTLNYIDTADARNLKYSFKDSVRANDTVKYPVKIGGIYYALLPLVSNQKQLLFNLHSELTGSKPTEFMHVFSINAKGDLVKHEILITINNVNKVFTVKDEDFDDEYKKFIPAQINHQPVDSKVYMPSTVQTLNTTSIKSF